MAKLPDFEDVKKTVKRKKLSLKKKPTGRYVDQPEDTDPDQLNKIEDTVKKVCNK